VSVPGGGARIKAGPYRLFGHPLYLGNLLLVAGVLRAFSPPAALVAAVLLFFLVEYALIVVAEASALARARVDSTARFGLSRVLSEWPTWLVTAAAFGLAVARQAAASAGRWSVPR
jgi:protein-S-isoprenylcysteine O-methyltransferase Ste14